MDVNLHWSYSCTVLSTVIIYERINYTFLVTSLEKNIQEWTAQTLNFTARNLHMTGVFP